MVFLFECWSLDLCSFSSFVSFDGCRDALRGLTSSYPGCDGGTSRKPINSVTTHNLLQSMKYFWVKMPQ